MGLGHALDLVLLCSFSEPAIHVRRSIFRQNRRSADKTDLELCGLRVLPLGADHVVLSYRADFLRKKLYKQSRKAAVSERTKSVLLRFCQCGILR